VEDRAPVADPTLLRPLDFAGEIHRLPIPLSGDLARITGAQQGRLVGHEETFDRRFYNVPACAIDFRWKCLPQSDALDLSSFDRLGSSLDRLGHLVDNIPHQRRRTRSRRVKIS
jgi:hypothetical protein